MTRTLRQENPDSIPVGHRAIWSACDGPDCPSEARLDGGPHNIPVLPAGWSFYQTPERLAERLPEYEFCSPRCQARHLLSE